MKDIVIIGAGIIGSFLAYDLSKYKLPTPHTENKYDVSFSGLKTAVINIFNINNMKGEETDINSLAASFEEKISQILSDNLVNAAEEFGFDTIAIPHKCADERLKTPDGVSIIPIQNVYDALLLFKNKSEE